MRRSISLSVYETSFYQLHGVRKKLVVAQLALWNHIVHYRDHNSPLLLDPCAEPD
jgi:hypothetical protein